MISYLVVQIRCYLCHYRTWLNHDHSRSIYCLMSLHPLLSVLSHSSSFPSRSPSQLNSKSLPEVRCLNSARVIQTASHRPLAISAPQVFHYPLLCDAIRPLSCSCCLILHMLGLFQCLAWSTLFSCSTCSWTSNSSTGIWFYVQRKFEEGMKHVEVQVIRCFSL